MPIWREMACAGSALVLFLFINAAFLGPDENDRINHSVTTGRSWMGAAVPAERFLAKDSITTGESSWIGAAPAEGRFIRDLTPAERIRKVFARFAPGESKKTI